jgi:hypothetical protein
MAVVGSTIMIDLHLTEDGDIDTVRGAVRQSDRVDPDLAGRVQPLRSIAVGSMSIWCPAGFRGRPASG